MPRKNWHSLSEYQALRAMMESNTTAAAARRLGLSQSAVSRALSSLEGRVGRTLFEREGGRLIATAAAVNLNARLDALFTALDAIDGPVETGRETLRLIAPPTFAGPFLVNHLAGFIAGSPEAFLSLEVGTSKDVIAGIADGAFDLGVTGVELTRAGVRLIPFRRSVGACAMPRGHPLSRLDMVTPMDLDAQKLITFSYRHARRAQLDKLLHEAGSQPDIAIEVSTSAAALDLVRAGAGVAVINPFPSAIDGAGPVVFRPFSSAISYQTYFVAPDGRPLPRVARQFMRHVRLHTPGDEFSQAV